MAKSLFAKHEETLDVAGLFDPRRIHGMSFQFSCTRGSHFEVISGTVTATSLSDEGGLQLHVSSPTIGGKRLASLQYNADKNTWCAYTPLQTEKFAKTSVADFERQWTPGTLRLL